MAARSIALLLLITAGPLVPRAWPEARDRKQFRVMSEFEIGTRLGMVDMNTGAVLKPPNQPVFEVRQPGLACVVIDTSQPAATVLTERLLWGRTNTIVNGALTKSPTRKDYVFRPGDTVVFNGLEIDKDFKWVKILATSTVPLQFTNAEGQPFQAPPTAELKYTISPESVFAEDYDRIADMVLQWFSATVSLPRADGRLLAGSTTLNPFTGKAVAQVQHTTSESSESNEGAATALLPQQPLVLAPSDASAAGGDPAPDRVAGSSESQQRELRQGQTPAEVEAILGKPNDTISIKEDLVYLYPQAQIVFENNRLIDVRLREQVASQVVPESAAGNTVDFAPTPQRLDVANDSTLAKIMKQPFSTTKKSNWDDVHRDGNGVIAPRLIDSPKPDYTEAARRAKYQGTVVLRLVVGPDGRVREVEVVRRLGLGLDEKAVEAVRRWRFQPGTKDGQPVAVQISVEVNFKLH